MFTGIQDLCRLKIWTKKNPLAIYIHVLRCFQKIKTETFNFTSYKKYYKKEYWLELNSKNLNRKKSKCLWLLVLAQIKRNFWKSWYHDQYENDLLLSAQISMKNGAKIPLSHKNEPRARFETRSAIKNYCTVWKLSYDLSA